MPSTPAPNLNGLPASAGPRIFYNCPSGNYYDYKAFAMGARSQVGHRAATSSATPPADVHALVCLAFLPCMPDSTVMVPSRRSNIECTHGN